ncbi:MAG: zinc-binding dehydrogenase [Candidatus Thorarchaeota archaeon]
MNGAGGSIGTIALQLAKSKGAEVTAVDSSSKFDMLQSLGVNHLIDYKQELFTERDETYDVIFDVVGVEISTVEIGPRTNRSTKFQLVPSTPINTIYTVSFEDTSSGIGVFLELEVEAGGAYKLAKKTIQKALSTRIAENTVEIVSQILEER